MSDEKKKVIKRVEILYICVAMAICVALAISIAAMSSLNMGEISVPEISFVPGLESSDTPVADVPTGGDENDVNATVESRYVYPVTGGGIQKEYSIDKLVFSLSMNDWRTHSGVDIAGEIGTDVLCFTDGTVSRVYTDPLYGKTVEITHADGLVTVYKNLDETLTGLVAEGIELLAGEKIGKIGATAGIESADDAHLHFEVMVDGCAVDPTEYLKEALKNAGQATGA